jgi:nucleoside-diphosphate-sugar epimerase
LAAVPAPGRVPDQVAFQNNIISTYNVFEAARKLKIKNIISASSETVLGLPMVRASLFIQQNKLSDPEKLG